MLDQPPDFGRIQQKNSYDMPYWSTRDQALLLGYKKWQRFEDAGILGQYTLTTTELEDKRQIPSGELYNTMPPHELAGNLLRITQTDYNLRTKAIQDEEGAIAEHYSNGKQVREAIIAMSGEKPEDIPPAPSIKRLVEERRRKARKHIQNKPTDNQERLF